jgi:glycosyltransferase involved in cell wall biosynthesis
MRLVFAHDHRFRRGRSGEVYTPSSFPASFWDRYLDYFDEVHVIARAGETVADDGRLARSDRDRVTFDFLPNLSSLRQLLFRSPEVDARVGAIIEAADAVVARLPSETGLLAVRHAKRLGKPYAVEVVGCAWDGLLNNGALSARIYAPIGFLRNRRAIADAPLALYVTSSWLQQRYPTTGHFESASNVALEQMTRGEAARREARLRGLAEGVSPVLGTIASLRNKSKGIQTALAALSTLRTSGLDLTYRVLGPGSPEPWRKLARKLGVADLVQFDGTRSAGAAVWAWLDDIDIHLQPSFQEGLPRATVEAMSRGAACIGSTCGGIPEVLPADRLHRPGDTAVLAAIIRRLATDPGAIAAASRADLETARQFDADLLEACRKRFFARLREQAGP